MKMAKLRVKGLLLDLDGTIVDSREAYLEAAKKAFTAIGEKNFDVKAVMEIPKRLEQNLPINDIVKTVDAQKFLDIYLKAYYGVTADKTRLMPNVQDSIKRLAEKTKLALITMRYVPKEKIIEELERFGLAKYFQHVTTALDTHSPKPSPEALIKCAEKLRVQTCDCAVVGDSVADVRAGKNAGAKTVAVLSGLFSRRELAKEKPDLILESLSQLPDFLE
ncbi:MAG: HAD family hydrolase [Candidatus Bathyarchaeia archaeon]